jgi:DNA-binding transcriptional MerR regulator
MVNEKYHIIRGPGLDLKRTYKLNEITQLFDIKRHFIIHLVEKGIIEPLVDAKGRGKSRIYSYKNLIEIGIFIYLNKLDLSYEMAGRVISKLKKAIKHYSKETIETMPYISILGGLDGRINISLTKIPIDTPHSPKDFLVRPSKKDISSGEFAYYFVIDIRNIITYINRKIS